jgi:hypothetical protein
MHKRGTRDKLIADLHAVVEDAEVLLKHRATGRGLSGGRFPAVCVGRDLPWAFSQLAFAGCAPAHRG